MANTCNKFHKNSIVDVWLGSKHTFEKLKLVGYLQEAFKISRKEHDFVTTFTESPPKLWTKDFTHPA